MSDDTNSKEYEIEKIIFHQQINNKILYFVKWKNCGLNGNTWEPEENLINCPKILNDYKTKNNFFKNKK
ncbi:chromobox protein homolog 3-like [Acyrthosiphon pisum]|uniref:Chromo domain-containing protein n=1 Tax=Acyrthosiphon pisum TaxID=7029 RepID=A0A8R2D513_ACYPI|nr:chromobox protein homolog 3-like [Acyrthosiphon pisum]|eukprot:XP_016660899.1 PREDICTED: chromobox protein homolog 3-like [Acyrthosiphon pisum]